MRLYYCGLRLPVGRQGYGIADLATFINAKQSEIPNPKSEIIKMRHITFDLTVVLSLTQVAEPGILQYYIAYGGYSDLGIDLSE